MATLAARLKSARKARNLTQRELADRVGMDQGHLSRLENGDKGVSTELLQSLARELGVTVSNLLGEDSAERKGEDKAKGTRADLLANYDAPAGLRTLASDAALSEALKITEAEWDSLASMKLPGEVSKDGYVQLLITLRAILGR